MEPMPVKNKKKDYPYKLMAVCLAALVLGSLVPLLAVAEHSNISKTYLLAMEVAGSATLLYVFGVYLLKK